MESHPIDSAMWDRTLESRIRTASIVYGFGGIGTEIRDQTTTNTSTDTGLTRWQRILTPSVGDVLFTSLFFIATQLGSNLTHRDGDLGRHIRLGRSILDTRLLPRVDIYSHTAAGGEMIPHEWIAQTVFAVIERWFGFDGIGVLVALVSALPWMILYRWMVRRSHTIGVSLGLALLGAAASMVHWAARPHMFTWLFVVVWVLLLEDLRRGRRTQVWILVPLTLLWANTHGAFIVGFILMATHLVGGVLQRPGDSDSAQRQKHLVLVLVSTVAASLVNPAGYKTILNSFAYTGESFLLQFTNEYNSPDFHSFLFWPFLAMIALTIVLRLKLSPTKLLLTLSWTAFALYSFRNIPLYAIVVTPILADGISSWWAGLGRGPHGGRVAEYAKIEKQVSGGLLAIVFVALIAVTLARSPGSAYAFEPGFFPIAALESVGADPPGEHVFNEFQWGGYIEFCCHPNVTVFIDGQTDYYGAELTMEYDEAIRGTIAWRDVFAKYEVDWVVISPDVGLAQVLVEADDWEEAYRDETAVVFIPAE